MMAEKEVYSPEHDVKHVLLASIVILFGGLFVGGPNYYDNRIVKELWELGHFILFLLLSLFLFFHPKLNRIEETKRAAIILGALLVFGFLTEVAQLSVGRNFQAKDLLNDFLGALTGLLIPHLHPATKRIRFVLPALLFISLVLFSARPLVSTVVSEIKVRQDFPVLSDFETPSQIKRWDRNLAELSVSDAKVKNGRFAMRAKLSPGKYPGITLSHMHGNWQGYEFIEFSVYLGAGPSIDLVVKVYDRQHPNSHYNYNDRFNYKLQLNPGWNDISLPLHLIESAPANRSMDMKDIIGFSLFTVNLDRNVSLYIDGLKLAKH